MGVYVGRLSNRPARDVDRAELPGGLSGTARTLMATLTPKQAKFVDEYLIDLCATKAAIRAGYGEKTARKIGSENLSKPDIQAAIEEAQKAASVRTQITVDEVLKRLLEINDRWLQGTPVMDSEGRTTGVWRFDAAGANRSAELLGKHLGMFSPEANVSIEQKVLILHSPSRSELGLDDKEDAPIQIESLRLHLGE